MSERGLIGRCIEVVEEHELFGERVMIRRQISRPN